MAQPKAGELSRVGRVLAASRSMLLGIGVFSCILNVLMLSGSLYMLQVYDRVLTSRSVPTLIALSTLLLGIYVFLGALDLVRQRILTRLGHRFDEDVGPSAFEAHVSLRVKAGPRADATQPIRDVDSLRQFFGGQGVAALFDMPWMPVYLLVVYLIHPVLGLVATLGALFLFLMAYLTDVTTRSGLKQVNEIALKRQALADAGRRNAEAVYGMGMVSTLGKVWTEVNTRFITANAELNDRAGFYSTISKVFRLGLQSAMLGVGAYLAVNEAVTGGAMIAASIIMGRALAPVETAVGNWRSILQARQAYTRLNATLTAADDRPRMALPAPRQRLTVDRIAVAPPGGTTPILADIRFELKAGDALGIAGPTGGGKSTLARAIVGVWPVGRGTISLDGAPLDQWPPDDLGRHIGYLPQDVELFDGTVEENIARFDATRTPEKVIAAARAAGVHDMVLRLPDGYATRIGEGGAVLSGGQRQRLGLARALYGEPFLLVLDEPNSNLDGDGDNALINAIRGVKARGGIVVMIAHRPSVMVAVDLMLVIEQGRQVAFGPRDQVIAKLMNRPPVQIVEGGRPPAPGTGNQGAAK
ncbi:type I secretion system permease/ATPase [Segnochrobactraceae bacterium EtOH-i3]